jgi:hypothetical protein
MKINKKGFGAVNVIITLVVVLTASGIGWQIYKKQNANTTKTATPNIAYKESSDSTDAFTYIYPENWLIEPYNWEVWGGSVEQSEPDWSQVSKPITLYPTGNPSAKITMTTIEYGDFWESYEDLKNKVKEDYFATILFEGQSEAGRKALFAKVDYLGPPDAKVESFTDHRYYYDNGKYVLFIEFREKYHHDWPDDEMGPDIDHSEYLSDFEYIAKSIKFSN